MPHIVLIAEKQELARALADRLLEVADVAKVLGVKPNPCRNAAPVSKISEDLAGRVGRAIVEDDQLVGRARLRLDRLKLGRKESGAIEGGHRHGYCQSRHLRRPFAKWRFIGQLNRSPGRGRPRSSKAEPGGLG